MKVDSTVSSPNTSSYVYLLLITLSTLHMAVSLPLPRSDLNLTSIVREAVEQSLQNHTNCSITSSHLTQSILTMIDNRNVELKRKCTPVSSQSLAQHFMSDIGLETSNCVSLKRISIPGSPQEEVFVATTNSSCVSNLRKDTVCFTTENSTPYCSISTNITYLGHPGEDFFPRFILSTECGGCRSGDSSCLSPANNMCGYTTHSARYRLLKRNTNMCDENGSELWEFEDEPREVSVGCSCSVQS